MTLLLPFVSLLLFPLLLSASNFDTSVEGLYVKGNKIYNKNNEEVRLRGINRSGAEYMCIQGRGIFDGPTDDESILAIKSWNVNIVRLPLNEDCWLNINGVPDEYGGEAYINTVMEFTERLNKFNIAVILSLLWSAPGTDQALGGQPMADQDHSVDFWKGVAQTFKNNSYVIFDLYNEPWPDFNRDSKKAWECWRDGGKCPGVDFEAAGMQELVDVVRNESSTNIVLCAGVRFANALDQFLDYIPKDPLQQLGASFHSYNFDPYPICNTENCWNEEVKPVNDVIPVIATETGEYDCSDQYVNKIYDWMDTQSMHYLGWTWNPDNCRSRPALISDYNGTYTPFGYGLYSRLTGRNNSYFIT